MLTGRPTPFRATFVYDDDGRVVGLEGEMDSPWTDEDVASARAVSDDDADRCGGCGHPRATSHDPATQLDWAAETTRCHACKAAAEAADKVDDRSGLGVRTWLDLEG